MVERCRTEARSGRGRQLCRGGAAFTIDRMGDAMGGPTANFTHHFLIAMPSMADPHFAHTLTYVCEHNEDGALGIVVNKPIDMTLSSLFEQIDVPLADAELRAHAGAFRRPGPGRSRLRAAPAARQLAVDAGDQRRPRPHDVEGRARGGRPRRGPEGRAGLAGLRRLVGRASSSRRSRRTPGSPSRPTRTCCSTRRPRRGCRRRCGCSASISRGCPTTSGTRDAWWRPQPPRARRRHGARVRLRHAADRRGGGQHARCASRIRWRRSPARRTRRASPRSRALIARMAAGAAGRRPADARGRHASTR